MKKFSITFLITHLFIACYTKNMVVTGDVETAMTMAKAKLKDILAEKNLQNQVTISVEVVDTIPLDNVTAKSKLIIPYEPEKAGRQNPVIN